MYFLSHFKVHRNTANIFCGTYYPHLYVLSVLYNSVKMDNTEAHGDQEGLII